MMNISGEVAIVGIAETDYVRGSDQSVPELVLDATMRAVLDAGIDPSEVDGIIPPPGFRTTWPEGDVPCNTYEDD